MSTKLHLHAHACNFHVLNSQALKVLNDALDHNRHKVSANTILFNIRQVSQGLGPLKKQGIEGIDSNGIAHKFLEGENSLSFSTRLYDVKSSPMYFAKVLQCPQMARVYLHPKTDKKEDTLQNLSTVTITDVIDGHDLVVRKLSDNGDKLGPLFTIPWNADLKVRRCMHTILENLELELNSVLCAQCAFISNYRWLV